MSKENTHRSRRRRRWLRAGVVCLLLACTKTPPAAPVADVKRADAPAADAPVRTDRAKYLLAEGPYGPETTIVTTFTAPRERAVSLENCNSAISLGLQKLVGNRWEHAWAVEMNACRSAPIVLPPGARRTETIVAASGADAAVIPRRTETKIDAGTYRVVWHAVQDLPLAQRVSAPFTIEIAPPRQPVKPAEIVGVAPEAGSEAAPGAPVRVRFASSTNARLYVDMHDVTDDATKTAIELEYRPPRGWPGGRHDVRVVFGRQWYAWSFTVGARRLDAAEAERLARLLAAAINKPSDAALDLDQYMLHGNDALRVGLPQYRTILGWVKDVRALPQEPHDPLRFAFELRGANGRTSRVEIIQQERTRMHSPLLDYGFRSERFMRVYLQAIASGDADRLAQVLNPDDVDIPVERARAMIAGYRKRYRDPARIDAEFVDVDERKHFLRWRLRGAGPDGREVSETIDLTFGDGLLGVRGLHD